MFLLGSGFGDATPISTAPPTGVDTSAAASASSALADAVSAFLQTTPDPSSSDVASFFQTFPDRGARHAAAQALVTSGVDVNTVAHALTYVNTVDDMPASYIRGVLTLAAASTALYHGYRRNDSLGWGLVWFGSGIIFPLVTSVVSLAQGYGRRKGS